MINPYPGNEESGAKLQTENDSGIVCLHYEKKAA